MKNFESRLWKKVSPEPNSGCWLWMGASTNQGYGSIKFNGKYMGVHRASYEHHIGPIPDGMVLDHLCRVPCCVNPIHLEPVTQRENVRRGRRGGKTHCLRGHLYDEANTVIHSRGTRACKRCMAAASAKRYADPKHRQEMIAYSREYYRKRRNVIA